MIGCIPGGFPDCGKELLSEVVSHHAVDDEVDAGVENSGEVRDVSETLDPSLGQERMISFSPQQEFIARNNILQVIELPDVDDGPWSRAVKEPLRSFPVLMLKAPINIFTIKILY